MARKLLIFLCLLFSSFQSYSLDEQTVDDIEGALERKDYKRVSDLTLKEVKKGNQVAMYYLAVAIIDSGKRSKIPDARKLLTISSKKGYLKSSMLLERLNTQVKLRNGTFATPKRILGTTIPTKQELIEAARPSANQYYAVHGKKDHLIKIDVFLKNTETAFNFNSTLAKLKDKNYQVDVTYYLYISDVENPFSTSGKPSYIPEQGYTPDYLGRLAEKNNIQTYPSVQVTLPNKKETVMPPHDVETHILNSYRRTR